MSGMKPFNWQQIQRTFLTSRAEICPYLPDHQEQKLVTLLRPGDMDGFADLTSKGFRRSHDAAYQPACPTCDACKPLRVLAQEFQANKTQRRLKRRYQTLSLSAEDGGLDLEHWALFQTYVRGRHGDGSMAHMSRRDFAAMIYHSPIQTQLLAWRQGQEGPLIAACLVDALPNGLSAVYSYFSLNPALPSLGTFIILALIDLAAKAGMAHVHLGYWVKGSAKMAYKAQFSPAEICVKGVWHPLSKCISAP